MLYALKDDLLTFCVNPVLPLPLVLATVLYLSSTLIGRAESVVGPRTREARQARLRKQFRIECDSFAPG